MISYGKIAQQFSPPQTAVELVQIAGSLVRICGQFTEICINRFPHYYHTGLEFIFSEIERVLPLYRLIGALKRAFFPSFDGEVVKHEASTRVITQASAVINHSITENYVDYLGKLNLVLLIRSVQVPKVIVAYTIFLILQQ